INPAAESLFDRKASELLGEMFGFPLVAGETTEIDLIRRGGASVVAEMRVVEIEWEGEISYLASLRDITDRKKAESARLQLISEQQARKQAEEANRVKDEFLATISHELRTPLTAILGWTRILRAHKLDESAFASALAIIERNAKAQTQIVDDLLDASQ